MANSEYLAGSEYTIADIAVWPWYGSLAKGVLYGAGEFLDVQQLHQRAALDRCDRQASGRQARAHPVNRTWGDPASQLHERHEASDFDAKTRDKIGEPADAPP